jgi:hypothetical protein
MTDALAGWTGTAVGRRAALLGLSGVCVAAAQAPEVTLLVAGPDGGHLDRWADVMTPGLVRALPGAGRMTRRTLGGVDGVTGANSFDALVTPDGATALLTPGAAPLAWLAGDPRAKFDPSRWVPVWAALAPAVLLTRSPLTPGRPLRVPAMGPFGPALPMLLALNLLGIEAVLLPPAAAQSPGEMDAVFLSGPGTPLAAASLAGAGLQPALTLGTPDDAGWGRDSAFPGVPTAVHQVMARTPPPPLIAALRATAVAVQLDALLVLPALSSAALVSAWHRACSRVAASPDMLTTAADQDVRSSDPAAAAVMLGVIAGGGPAIPALQQWFSGRYG